MCRETQFTLVHASIYPESVKEKRVLTVLYSPVRPTCGSKASPDATRLSTSAATPIALVCAVNDLWEAAAAPRIFSTNPAVEVGGTITNACKRRRDEITNTRDYPAMADRNKSAEAHRGRFKGFSYDQPRKVVRKQEKLLPRYSASTSETYQWCKVW